ncbi:efflux RND transporter periplasmic adaptor subunit [Psychromonas arctica]|uniref:efflux RND transporter periplasmic adaptor subunit n=1 Tax=Psychromonas arctica TaxID=168275 RepID=UPI0004151A87|nr:efflux RND transporter periplasmic adaptor subunit [Psychromonas arctica]
MIVDQQTWDSIAQLKPKLRSHVTFYQHVYRQRIWHIVADTLSSSHFRCTELVFQFIQCLDGSHSIEQAYQHCLDLEGEQALEHIDIINVIATLQLKGLLQGDISVSVEDLYQRYSQHQRQQKMRIWSRPLSFKLSLWDPDLWLEKITPLFAGVFNRWVLILSACLIMLGSSVAVGHWQALAEHFSVRFMGPQNLVLIWLLYPLVKFFHELGHAISTKYWGGEVHDMGVLFIVFMPVPYVDASTSHQFSDKNQRMMVAAAGIFIELLLAALSILCWSVMDDGIARDIAFNIAVVAGLSTLFVNGNPLLRFDGYYVFSDAIEIPNLASRSSKYLAYLCQRFLLGLDRHTLPNPSPITADGERSWFLFYGIAAGIYKLIISFSIAFFVASHYFIIGVILALWYLLQQLLLPTFSALKTLFMLAKEHGRFKRLTLTTLPIILLFSLLFFYPLHWSSHIEGIATLPEAASIRVKSDGFMKAVLKNNNEQVKVGDILFELENPELVTKKQLIKAQIAELEIRENQAFMEGPSATQVLKLEIQHAQATLADIQVGIDSLAVKSKLAGVISIPKALDMPGRFYRKGDILGYVIDLNKVSIKAIIPQNKFEQLKMKQINWQVKLNSQPMSTFNATTGQEIPQASFQLPSAKLGTAGGGAIIVDARDKEGRTVLEAVYQVELIFVNYTEHYLAAKVIVKVNHQPDSFAAYLSRILTLFFSAHFQ